MSNLETLGLVAGALTTSAFVPQVWRIWKTRSADDISLLGFSVFTLGLMLWTYYGWQLQSLPIVLTNGVTLGLSGLILILKWRFSTRS